MKYCTVKLYVVYDAWIPGDEVVTMVSMLG